MRAGRCEANFKKCRLCGERVRLDAMVAHLETNVGQHMAAVLTLFEELDDLREKVWEFLQFAVLGCQIVWPDTAPERQAGEEPMQEGRGWGYDEFATGWREPLCRVFETLGEKARWSCYECFLPPLLSSFGWGWHPVCNTLEKGPGDVGSDTALLGPLSLPSAPTAASLVAAGGLTYELGGQPKVAFTRAARGHARDRAPPPSESVAACLEITALTDLGEDEVQAAAESWRAFLRPWSVGLSFRHLSISFGEDESKLPKTGAGDGIFVVGASSDRSADVLRVAQALLSAGHKCPVLALGCEDSQTVDVLPWPSDQARAGALVDAAVRRACGLVLRERLKVFVCDCDQTLWGGVVAEDGVEALDMTGPFHLLQEKVSALEAAGRLVCLASRNEEEDVLRVFADRQGDMALRREQLSAWQVHWGSKALSLRRLASELQLGLEAFVFLDDNPGEIEAVRLALPEVLTILVPSEAAASCRMIRSHWALDAWSGTRTVEDARRTQMYREAAQRKAVRRASTDFASFLTSLQGEECGDRGYCRGSYPTYPTYLPT
ncbi:unnamed protein product [Symbiodinium natans]|uniref:FCP1 homology domain-containing protein n=1 Tax=Symbiodinium natans TaxID=878477 RepID=A0A812M0K7_9DINO|nr:unnamed protein product [Symbiodinium natans]